MDFNNIFQSFQIVDSEKVDLDTLPTTKTKIMRIADIVI